MNKAIYGGVVAGTVILFGSYMVGQLSDFEALDFLKAMLPSTRFLCSAVITSTSTILALILTLISFSNSTDKSIKSEHYDSIKFIAKLSTAAFIGAVILLLFINLPLENASDKLMVYFEVIYYFLLVYVAILGGLLITITLMLYQAAENMILIVHPEEDTNLLITEEESQD